MFDIISVIGIFTLVLLIFILYQIKINDHILNDFQKIEIIIKKLLLKIKIIKKVIFNEIFVGRKQKFKIKIKIWVDNMYIIIFKIITLIYLTYRKVFYQIDI